MTRGQLVNTIQVTLDNLNDLSQKADQSKKHCFAAQGLFQSGSMQKWKDKIEKDKQFIKSLIEKFLILRERELSGRKLELDILELHRIEQQIKSLTEDFMSSMKEDDAARDRIFHMKFGNQK